MGDAEKAEKGCEGGGEEGEGKEEKTLDLRGWPVPGAGVACLNLL